MINRIDVIIVEDDTKLASTIQKKLQYYFTYLNVLAIAYDVLDAYKKITELKPQLVFLDLHLGNSSGFELLDLCSTLDFETIIISADDKQGIKAVKYQALDYIVKPIQPKELIEAVERVKKKNLNKWLPYQDNKLQETITISTGDKLNILLINDIIYVKADQNYSWVHIPNKKLYASSIIKDIEKKLPKDQFCRVHKSYLVNIKKAKSFVNKKDGSYLIMIDEVIIPVSESKKKDLLQVLNIK